MNLNHQLNKFIEINLQRIFLKQLKNSNFYFFISMFKKDFNFMKIKKIKILNMTIWS